VNTCEKLLAIREREVLVLRYFADLPEHEIAAATGISRGAVRSHAARALTSLRAELRAATGGGLRRTVALGAGGT
jgi:RNA polymerase sigma factor (sigma-70 family)